MSIIIVCKEIKSDFQQTACLLCRKDEVNAMNIDLRAEERTVIEDLVNSGRYASLQDAMREAVRLLVSQEQLRKEVRLGVAQADRGELVDHKTVFGHLRTLAAARRAESGQ